MIELGINLLWLKGWGIMYIDKDYWSNVKIRSDLGTDPKKKNYEDSEHGPICGRGGSRISLKKNIYL